MSTLKVNTIQAQSDTVVTVNDTLKVVEGIDVTSDDTTITRASAGNIAVESKLVYRADGTDVPIADGGTGASTAEAARTSLDVAQATTSLAEITSPDIDDLLQVRDISAAADKKISVQNLFKVINTLTTETAPAATDKLSIYDASESAANSITLQKALNVIDVLTEDTNPDITADSVVTYDASSGDSRKVKVQNLLLKSGYKNAIINGDFNVWQRGTTFSSIASNDYSADRWQYQKTGTMVHDIVRSTDVPTVAQAERAFNYSLLVDCTTVDSSIAAGDFCFIAQKIEGYNWLPLAQKATTLSFWVKATKTGIYCVSIGGIDRRYIAEYTINDTNTWEKKTVTFTASPQAGTWDYINGIGCAIRWVLAAGSSLHDTANSWITTSSYAASATANQVNACDSTANNFLITGVKFEDGEVATEFDYQTFHETFELCQRYYEKSFDYAVAPAQNAGFGLGEYDVVQAVGASTSQSLGTISFTVPKRAEPTIVTYSPTNASAEFYNPSAGAQASAVSLTISERAITGTFTTAGGSAAGNRNSIHWAANAEL